VIEGPEVNIVEKIKRVRSKDKDIVRVIEEMKKAKVKEMQGEEWKIEGGLVLKKGKIYVSKDEELRAEIILSRSLMVDFILFPLFIFLFLEQLGLGFISHTVTSVTKVMA